MELFQEGNSGRRLLEDIHGDTGFAEKLFERIVGVFGKNHYSFDPGVNHHLGTEDARSVGAVDGTAFEADAVQGGLDDNILFGVNSPADFVAGTRGNIIRVAQAA